MGKDKNMGLSNSLNEALKLISSRVSEARQGGDSGSYLRLGAVLAEMKNVCRETLQLMTRDKANEIIKKLKGNLPISADDLQVVRLWIIGDVEQYVRGENNFEDWLKEVDRLSEEIKKLDGRMLDDQGVKGLQALLVDLDRTIQDIIQYLTDKERIATFENATQDIDPDERKTLVDILSRKLESPDM